MTELYKELNYKISQALPSTALENLGFRVVNYLDLFKYTKIEQVVDEKGIILYTPISQKSLGHYSCLWLRNNSLYYWCSYGYNLSYTAAKSDYMQYTPEKDEEYLMTLVKDFINRGGIFSVNHVKYQNLNENTSTCGRYCIIRLLKRNMSHEEFYKFFTLKQKYPNMSNDELVTMLTYIV